eukprot:gene6482-10487_t
MSETPDISAQELKFLSALQNSSLPNRDTNPFYYTIHKEDAIYYAETYEFGTAGIKTINGIELRSISQLAFENAIKDLLLNKNKKVELWKATKNGTFELSKKATPGNVQDFEEIIFGESSGDSNCLACVKVTTKNNQNFVGISLINTSMSRIQSCEFVDNHQFSILESILVQSCSKECIYSMNEKDSQYRYLVDVFERCEITKTQIKSYNTSVQMEDVHKIIQKKYTNHDALNLKEAMKCLFILIEYLSLLDEESNENYFHFDFYKFEEFMRIDNTVLRSFNIFKNTYDDTDVYLFKILNKCKSKIGTRRLEEWIRKPLLDVEEIKKRHDVVDHFYQDFESRIFIEESMKKIPDLDKLSRKYQTKRAKIKDAVEIYQFIENLRNILEYLKNNENEIWERYLSNFEVFMVDFDKLKEIIEKMVDLEKADENEYIIHPKYDPELLEIDEEMNGYFEKLEVIRKKAEENLGLSVELKSDEAHGKHLRVPQSKEKIVKDAKYKIVNKTKVGLKFVNDKFLTFSQKYDECYKVYQKKQKEIESKLTDCISTYVPLIEESSELISELDILSTFAIVGLNSSIPYVRPTMQNKEEMDIILKKSRHPCLEAIDSLEVISNDIELKKDDKSFIILTGCNMGGKSTFIKQVALIVLMSQIGSFVPCDEAIISVKDAIYSRVGASDYQQRGLSTFMAEMIETSTILHSATKYSIVIVDELGRGTSTYDGFGLAYSISKYIIENIKSICLFATHFHELSSLEKNHKSVANYHMEAKEIENKLIMMYEVKSGVSHQSFGIQVAELAKFPKPVIQLAKRKLDELEDFNDDKMVEEPQSKKQKYENEEEIISFFKYFCQSDLSNQSIIVEKINKIQLKE